MAIPDVDDRVNAAIEKFDDAASIAHDVANLPVGSFVDTESGPVPSIAQWQADHADQLGDIAGINTRLEAIEDDASGLSVEVDPSITMTLSQWMAKLQSLSIMSGKYKYSTHVADWGIEGSDMVTAPINEGAKLQQAAMESATGNQTLIWDARNYLTDRELLVNGLFRSFKWQGAGNGNAQTASTAGTTLMTNGGYRALRVEFNAFANENFRIEGMQILNRAMNLADFEAVAVIRGANNSRYVSGFIFRDVGIKGFGAAMAWQGMNTVDAGNNYFGNIVYDNCQLSDNGIGLEISNAVLNLLSLRGTLIHTAPQGAIRLFRDGLVGAGLGLGSAVTMKASDKSHMEDAIGMMRSQTTRTMGGTGTPYVIRSTFHLDGVLHEVCGSSKTGAVASGDPWGLGVDTDVIITGDTNYNLGFNESDFPTVGPGNTVTSSTPCRLVMAGGRSNDSGKVNAPRIKRTVANGSGAAQTITITSPDTGGFSLQSKLLLNGGALGLINSVHSGTPTGTKSTTVISGAAASGVTFAFTAGASGDVLRCIVENNTGSPITAELQIDNLSSTTILTASEY